MTLEEIQEEVGIRVNSDADLISRLMDALELAEQIRKQNIVPNYADDFDSYCQYESRIGVYTDYKIAIHRALKKLESYDMWTSNYNDTASLISHKTLRAKEIREMMSNCRCIKCNSKNTQKNENRLHRLPPNLPKTSS